MSIQFHRNLYHGVNAHLHSHFQAHGGWSGFHGMHMGHLAEAINSRLPAGYLVDIEQSLQIREVHPDTGERILRPQPDVTVYQTTRSGGTASPAGGAVASLTLPLLETLETDEDQYYAALVLYRVVDDESLGRPVTRIELLSPSNKDGAGYLQYREKRNAALKSGLCLVEIDYLHETVSPVRGLPSYPRHQSGAYPYTITVSNPTPSLEDGVAQTYGFGVDEPIPSIALPLAAHDTILVEFDAAYQRTYESLRAYSHRVDYAESPDHFEAYSAEDQARIQAVMARALETP